MKLKKLSKCLVFLALLSLAGCADEATCIPENTDLLQLSFIDENGKASAITVVSLEVEGGNDYFPIIQDSTFSTLSVPLNPLDSVIQLNFVQESETNSITLNYRATPRLSDPKCGLETFFNEIETESTNFIDVEIVNPVLNKDITTNVKITH